MDECFGVGGEGVCMREFVIRAGAAGDDFSLGEFSHGAVDGFKGEVEGICQDARVVCSIEHTRDTG